MIFLCIRGALIITLWVASCAFWVWLLAPATRGQYGTAEYREWKQDYVTTMFGGLGLVICLIFLAAIAFHYWNRWS